MAEHLIKAGKIMRFQLLYAIVKKWKRHRIIIGDVVVQLRDIGKVVSIQSNIALQVVIIVIHRRKTYIFSDNDRFLCHVN